MADTVTTTATPADHTAPSTEQAAPRRNEKVGQVVSTKMQKTIVVEIEMRKAHPKYKRVMKSNKKFYAHDEQNSARVGDVVRIRETRPLSKLKRWSLEEIIRRSSLSALPDEKPSRAENAIQKTAQTPQPAA
jgi:small subunit ribosomal protein S17